MYLTHAVLLLATANFALSATLDGLRSKVLTMGGLVEITPLFFQDVVNEPVEGMKPYTALQLEGRDIYIKEGCVGCHSQMIRPFRAETERYGHYSVAGEFVYVGRGCGPRGTAASPIAAMRAKLTEILRTAPEWDGKVDNLAVTEVSERTLQVRCLVSARNAGHVPMRPSSVRMTGSWKQMPKARMNCITRPRLAVPLKIFSDLSRNVEM